LKVFIVSYRILTLRFNVRIFHASRHWDYIRDASELVNLGVSL